MPRRKLGMLKPLVSEVLDMPTIYVGIVFF